MSEVDVNLYSSATSNTLSAPGTRVFQPCALVRQSYRILPAEMDERFSHGFQSVGPAHLNYTISANTTLCGRGFFCARGREQT